jgi:hypothetical protein
MRFENPANGYVEEVTNAPLWCLLVFRRGVPTPIGVASI